jgi:hypothetical protein
MSASSEQSHPFEIPPPLQGERTHFCTTEGTTASAGAAPVVGSVSRRCALYLVRGTNVDKVAFEVELNEHNLTSDNNARPFVNGVEISIPSIFPIKSFKGYTDSIEDKVTQHYSRHLITICDGMDGGVPEDTVVGQLYHLQPCRGSKRLRNIDTGDMTIVVNKGLVLITKYLHADDYAVMPREIADAWLNIARTNNQGRGWTMGNQVFQTRLDADLHALVSTTLALSQPRQVMRFHRREGSLQDGADIIHAHLGPEYETFTFQDSLLVAQPLAVQSTWWMRTIRFLTWTVLSWRALWD